MYARDVTEKVHVLLSLLVDCCLLFSFAVPAMD